MGIQFAESLPGRRVPLFCGLAVPVCSLGVVLRNALAALVQGAKIELGVSVALVGGLVGVEFRQVWSRYPESS